MKIPKHILAFATTLKRARPPANGVALGEMVLPLQRGRFGTLQYNQEKWELLNQSQDYLVTISNITVHLSVQLYLNVNNHYRLFAFAKSEKTRGMMFSLNFTTSKDADGIIALTQKIRFGEGRGIEKQKAQHVRQAKAKLMADILVRSGFTVTDNLEIELGMYDSKRHRFLNTTASMFLSQFLAVALLKGHFQGNKGFQFSCLPRFDDSFPWEHNSAEAVRAKLKPNSKGLRGLRSVPLSLRYQVLERDGGKCKLCGSKPGNDVVLHVDHIRPYSLGGTSVLDNLQTLCQECNLGKGNRSEFRC